MDRCVLLTSTPECVVSPRGDHSDCALVIARRGETTLNPVTITLQWRHNERDGVSNHKPNRCLLEFPAQMVSNAENVSIWWSRRVYS